MIMRFFRKRHIKRALYAKVVIAVLAVIVIFTIGNTWDIYKKASFAKQKRDEAVKELQSLQERKESLSLSVASLDTKRGIEEEVRSKFGVVKEGEEVVVIIDETSDKKSPESKKSGFWHTVVSFFGLE